ncbi:MAG: hypothetical protein ACRERD_16010, partial [Candidatus Binatia bacterium]
MNHRSLFGIILALGCWLYGTALLWAEQPLPSTYFPLAVGDHWVYEFSTSTDAKPIYESVAVIAQEE